jgi:G:T-mismatch repair DNA endonuclease (very short patch repair protein)
MGKKWSKKETKILKENYSICSDQELVEIFSGRTLSSIKVKAKKFKLKRTDKIKFINRRFAHSGVKNGMYGKKGARNGVKLSDEIKYKLSVALKGKRGLGGVKNPMYGKTPHNFGKNLTLNEKLNLSKKAKIRWESLSCEEKEKRKNKLSEIRHDFIRNKKSSKIEVKIKKFLDDIKIDFEFQKKIGNYCCDFVINDTVLEIQGDYWHGNPIKFKTYDLIQNKNILRDLRKKEFLEKNNYKLVLLWESEINSSFEECKKRIYEIIGISTLNTK